MSLLRRRRWLGAAFLGCAAALPLILAHPAARAQTGALPPLPSSTTSASGSALPTTVPPLPTVSATTTVPDSSAWQSRYDAAGHKMTSGDFLGAIQDYSNLAATAPNETARNLAIEQLRIASDYAARNGQPAPPAPVGSAPPPPPPGGQVGTEPTPPVGPRQPDRSRRTLDELVFLYLAAPAYGFTTGFWVDSLITAQDGYRDTATLGSFFIGLGATGISALAIALVDNAKGFKYGMPQAIFSGFTVGFGAGMGMALWAGNRSSTSFSTYRKFTSFVWGFSTAGAIAGAVLSATLPTTPGRSAWVGTTAIATGFTIGGIAAAATPQGTGANDENARNFGLTAALSGIAGAGIGLATAPLLSPSISRVRFIDLGWLSGGALGLGFCAAYGNGGKGCSERATFGAMGAGAGIGFAAGLIATFMMKPEGLPSEKKDSLLEHMMPTISPTDGGGFAVGLMGPL